MACDPEKHHRRSIRLKGYDYSQAGAYFITICTQDRACLFGDVVDGVIRLDEAGQMIQSVWDEIPAFYPGVDTDTFVVMPNHVHGIIVLVGATPRGRPVSFDHPTLGQAQGPAPTVGDAASGQAQGVAPAVGDAASGQAQGPAPTLSVPDVVHRFKTLTTKRYADGVKQSGWVPFRGRLWQRNYYEHIIRDEESLNRIRQYVLENPIRWAFDRENIAATNPEPGEAWCR